MGVFDPFAIPMIRAFYDNTAREDSGVPVKLHVMRLNGEIVAVRYNIVHGDRLFCLISSMSDDPAIQNGSPGKQCLLRVMQTVFDAGLSHLRHGRGPHRREAPLVQCADPGAPPLHAHHAAAARFAAQAHRGFHTLRRRIKNDERLLGWAKCAAR